MHSRSKPVYTCNSDFRNKLTEIWKETCCWVHLYELKPFSLHKHSTALFFIRNYQTGKNANESGRTLNGPSQCDVRPCWFAPCKNILVNLVLTSADYGSYLQSALPQHPYEYFQQWKHILCFELIVVTFTELVRRKCFRLWDFRLVNFKMFQSLYGKLCFKWIWAELQWRKRQVVDSSEGSLLVFGVECHSWTNQSKRRIK